MATSLYCLRDVRVQYAGRTVLDIREWDLPRGGITALVGPNGAGKTTLLRILAFLLSPSSGRISFEGQVLPDRSADLAALRRQATLVFQSPFMLHRSVRANVAYGLEARGLDANGRIDTALNAVGLNAFAARPAWKLSGGEAQRVAIARALAIDPPVYLFDEPTASVDREQVAVIERLVAGLGERRTVVFTTHNIEQAYRMSDRVLSLVNGRVTAAPLVNVLRGEITGSGDARYFNSDGLRIEISGDSTPRAIALDPEDIVLSREPLHSSARNYFAGQVIKAERDERGMLVTVDCGRPLVARITRHSYEELALNIGTRVWLTFKSSAIHVLDE